LNRIHKQFSETFEEWAGRSPFGYALKAYLYLPVTFVRRSLWGEDIVLKEYFWNRWGFLDREELKKLNGKETLWVEAQSLGELYQINPLCRWMKETYSEYPLILSTSDISAFQKARDEKLFDLVFHSPWDLPAPVNRLFHILKPKALFFVEHAKMPLQLRVASERGIQTALLSGFFPEGWEHNGFMKRPMRLRFYESLQWIGAKGDKDAEAYRCLGVRPERIFVVGDLKFSVEENRLSEDKKEKFWKSLGLASEEILWIAGSLHPHEVRFIASAYQHMKVKVPRLRLLIAPRWLEHLGQMESVLRDLSLPFIRKSKIETEHPLSLEKIILLDTYGELKVLYGLAAFVFLGGSLPTEDPSWKGLSHNVAEPLIHEKPIFFGKNVCFRQSLLAPLLECWDGLQVENPESFAKNAVYLLEHPELREKLRKKCDEIVRLQRGSLSKHKELITRILR